MVGLGTLINVACIVTGGLVGLLCRGAITQRLQQALLRSCGVAVMFVGIAGTLEKMLSASLAADGAIALTSGGTMMMVVCLAVGTVLGEALDLDARFEDLGVWLREKTGNSGDARFVDGFVTASLTVSIGAMAIVGAIQDGVSRDYSTLAVKAVLDCVIIAVMTATLGRGCIFSAIPVFVLEGTVTLLAQLLAPALTELAASYLSLIGSILIFCVGVNLVWGKLLRVANMLPAISFAIAFSYLPWSF